MLPTATLARGVCGLFLLARQLACCTGCVCVCDGAQGLVSWDSDCSLQCADSAHMLGLKIYTGVCGGRPEQAGGQALLAAKLHVCQREEYNLPTSQVCLCASPLLFWWICLPVSRCTVPCCADHPSCCMLQLEVVASPLSVTLLCLSDLSEPYNMCARFLLLTHRQEHLRLPRQCVTAAAGPSNGCVRVCAVCMLLPTTSLCPVLSWQSVAVMTCSG
jgi:hypothetical protein